MADTGSPESRETGVPDKSLIVNPINIARARYASMMGESAADKTRQPPLPAGHKARSKEATSSDTGLSLFSRNYNCLLISLLGLVFLAGGILGGMIGGGLVLWANNSDGLVLLAGTPTLAPLPTPTPVPVETLIPTPTPLPAPTLSTEDIIARVIPSVVTVINQHFSLNLADSEGRVAGSGVIVDARGYIATNHHVIENPGDLSVILADGRQVRAELVASEPAKDLAVVRVDAGELPSITWGDSSTVRAGQYVYAIGSPLGDFPNSVSFGIVSGLNRALEINEYVIDGLIQTDAAVNRGSSGGPLLNVKGEMIGINTFIIRESETRGVTEGIAFAIPTNAAKRLLFPWIAADRGESVPIPASGEPNN